MAEPFDVTLDGPQGVSLAPQGSAEDVGLLPDPGTVLGPPPKLALPPPPPPPPSPTEDPRQQLAALMALGLSVGMGPRAGGAGALQGFAQTQQALRQDQLGRYQRAVNDQKLEEAALKSQFTQDSIDYRQREAKLQAALTNFKAQAMKVSSKAEYDGLAEAYGNSLRAAGYRTIDPNWLRQQIPYVKPSQTSLAEKAFKAWQSNPNNKRLLDDDPATAMSSQIEVDLNGDGIKERMPLAKLAEAAGQSFAHDADGKLIAVPITTKAGTSAFDIALQNQVDQFTAENRRPPSPREKQKLIDKALEQTRPPKSEPTVVVQTVDDEGNPVTKIVKKEAGSTFAKAPGATMEGRLASAKAVVQTGNDMIAQLRDPNVARRLGVAMGRVSSIQDFIGNPPPEFAKLVGLIESYSLANMGVHGMRSNNGAEAIKYTLGVGRHTPESIIATIEGLNGFAQHLLQNEGGGKTGGDAHPPLQKYGATYTWDGAKYVRQ